MVKNGIKLVFAAIGLVILGVVVKKIGVSAIASNFKTLSWRSLLLLSISFTFYLLYTFAWMEFLKGVEGKIRFLSLFRAKLIGEAVNTVTPANFVGGDPVRAYILKGHYPITSGAASVIVDRTIHIMATLAVIITGVVLAFWKMPFLPLNIRYGAPIVLLISSAFVLVIYVRQRSGLFASIAHIIEKINLKMGFSNRVIQHLLEIDKDISNFYKANPKAFLIAFLLHFAGRVLGILEIYVAGKAFSGNFTLETAIFLGTITPLVNLIFTFVPGALGIMEGVYTGFSHLIGIPPSVGLSIQIYRRCRAAFWLSVGFVLMALYKKRDATSINHRR